MRIYSRALLFALAILTLPGLSQAQSACTAMWGAMTIGTNNYLGYFNTTTNRWNTTTLPTLGTTAATNPNGVAVDRLTGLVYYIDRSNGHLHNINLNTNVNSDTVQVIPLPAGATGVTVSDFVGAAFDTGGNLWIYLTDNATTQGAWITQINKSAPATTLTSWMPVLLAAGTKPKLGGSGDIYFDNSNQAYILTNSNAPLRWNVALTAGSSFARATATNSVTLASIGAPSIAGVASDPVTQNTYFSTTTSGSNTYLLGVPAGTTVASTLKDNSTGYTVSDMGSCITTPSAPTITKTITPAYNALTNGTATVQISVGNANSVPIWLFTTLTDALPAGLVVSTTPSLSGSCVTAGNVVTATAGLTTMTFASGGAVPSGGCTIRFNVSATASATPYVNTIPIGSLTTSAGTNAAGTTATYQVGTDFAAVKSQCVGTCGTTSTGVVTVPGGQTLQYVLTVTNSTSGGTGSVTFTDTLPALVTPVLSITAGMTGGGSCTTASAVVGGTTRVTGTVVNAPAGAQCTVTVTALVSAAQSVATNVTNTLTLAATASTTDTNAPNNSAAVPTTVGPSAVLTISKTNGQASSTAGSTISYTVTIANLGPAAAPGTVALDPGAPGLNCTTVTFTSTPVGSVTVSPTPLTMTALQTTGITFTPSFPAGSTGSLRITCGVTATGQ